MTGFGTLQGSLAVFYFSLAFNTVTTSSPLRNGGISVQLLRQFLSLFWKNPGRTKVNGSFEKHFVTNFDIGIKVGIIFDVYVNLSVGCLRDLVDCDVVGMFW